MIVIISCYMYGRVYVCVCWSETIIFVCSNFIQYSIMFSVDSDLIFINHGSVTKGIVIPNGNMKLLCGM